MTISQLHSMKMTEPNIAGLAALGVAPHMLYDNTVLHLDTVVESEGDFATIPYGMQSKAAERLSQEWTSQNDSVVGRRGKVLPNQPRSVRKAKVDKEYNTNAVSSTARKSDKISASEVDISGEKTDTPGIVTDPAHPQSGHKKKRCLHDGARKHGKLHRNFASSFDLLSPCARSSTRSARKVSRSSLRRLKQSSGMKSLAYEGSIEEESNDEVIGDKAENNNWMLDSEDQSNSQKGLVVPTLHIKSCAAAFSSFIQPNSDSKPSLKETSVDNLSGVLRLSRQSSNVQGDVNLEENFLDGRSMTRSAESPDSTRVSGNAGVCVACGNDVQIAKCAFCKQCELQNWTDDNHYGPLDELKAYAQSFANSVKKILLNSPVLELSSEILSSSIPEWKNEESAKSTAQEEDVPKKQGPEIGLNRYMTEIHMGSHAETRSKSLLSKSMSYDGRVGASMEEKGTRSTINWINQSRIKTSDSFSKMADYRQSRVEGDGFIHEKEEKPFLVYEGDRNRINRAEKLKAKVSVKQLARVERARTDGDLRSNNVQPAMPNKKQAKDESKKGFEFQRNRSKTFHELDACCEDSDSCSPQSESETDVTISRLKVIHEGSPVDPPNTADRKGDEGKGRKAVFIRSATAPYKNHLPRKEIVNSLTVLDNVERNNRSNTKIWVRTNKASTLRKENSLSDRRKMQDMLETYAEDDSVVNSMSFTKKRSTSFDSGHVGPKRDELHRSSSWSVIEGDEEDGKHRREASTVDCVSVKRCNEIMGFSLLGEPPTRFRARDKDRQSAEDMSLDPFMYRELSGDTFKQKRHEASHTEASPVDMSLERSLSDNEEQLQLRQSQSEYASESEKRYYDDGAEEILSSYIGEGEHIKHQDVSEFDSESYYTENPKFISLEMENAKNDRYNDNSDLKHLGEGESLYHDGIKKYHSPDIPDGKNSPWYSPLQVLSSDDRSLMRRDRSLESKSTTSFHIVTMAKSSHSDEGLTKYGGVLEHALSRRQSMYTETDVDTGLIYHLAKRQTTRAQVPNYHDLTSVSREIYTMSGDVSRSTSSNSASSNKSETSECLYTGGFYKDDPFYDHDNEGTRSSSSQESADAIYFESVGVSKREQSEIDIYTGSIFNSNQNTMASSQGNVFEGYNEENGVKDSIIMTSSRSNVGKMQRSVRCRPRVDTITFRNNNYNWGYFSVPIMVCGDRSNNSNNWYGMDEYDNSCPSCTVITKSADPMYTDYDPGMRPEFNVRQIEKTGTVFNFLKYDHAEEANKTFFSPPRRDEPGNDGIWYSGLLHDQGVEETESLVTRAHQSVERSPYSWQYHDDYYTSTVRPIVNKTNNCSSCQLGSFPCDTNNNHFDDIYTGSYGAQNVPPAPQEPAPPSRPPAAENWYVKQATPTYTSSTLYDQGYESCYTVPGQPRRTASDLYEPLRDPYSSYSTAKPSRPEPPTTCDSSVYMMDDGWWKYGPKVTSQPEEPRPRKPEKHPSGEPESYFTYGSKTSPERNFYVIDDDTYSFEPKVESELPEAPIVKEIRTVGGIVCRENVVNKDDYAEDINRDLEPGAWAPFSFRRDEDAKYLQETSGGHEKPEVQRASEGLAMKHLDDTYANNRLYDNFGARKNWQRPQGKQENTASRSRDSSQHRSFQAGDTGRQDTPKSLNRNASDIIPDKARGKRSMSNTPKTTLAENSSGAKSSGNSTASKNKRR